MDQSKKTAELEINEDLQLNETIQRSLAGLKIPSSLGQKQAADPTPQRAADAAIIVTDENMLAKKKRSGKDKVDTALLKAVDSTIESFGDYLPAALPACMDGVVTSFFLRRKPLLFCHDKHRCDYHGCVE